MKKFGKKGIVAAVSSLIAALSVSAIVPVVANAGEDTATLPAKGFESESVEIKGSNEALSNWMFYFYGDKDAEGKDRGTVYDSENLHVSATTEGRTGNALHLKRDKADGELVMYSYAFDVKPDQNYVIGAFVKSLCAQTADKSRARTGALSATNSPFSIPLTEEERTGRKRLSRIKRPLPRKLLF